MATVYEYKGASYELPDGLSNEAALAKIKASLGEAQPSAQPTTQPTAEAPQEQGLVDRLKRQAGLATRAVVTGVSAPSNIVTDFLSGAYNVGANIVGSEKRAPYLSREQSKGLTQLGVPEPETGAERAAQAGMQGLVSAGGMAATAPKSIFGADLVRQLPAATTAPMVAQPVAEATKEVTGSDMAAMIAALGVSGAVGKTTGDISGRLAAGKQPTTTMADVQQKASRAYTKVSDQGIEISGQNATSLVDKVKSRLDAADYIPENAAPVANILNKYESILQRGNITFDNVEQMRRLANNLKSNPDKNIRRLAGEMVDSIDDHVATLSPKDVVSGAGGIDVAVKTIMEARKDFRNLSRASTLDNILNVAETKALNPSASESELIRQGFIGLAANKNKMNLFSKDEQNAIKAVAQGSTLDPLLTLMAKFNPQRSQLITGGAVGFGMGSPETLKYSIPIAAAGYGADKLQALIRRQSAEKAMSGLLTDTTPSPQPSYFTRGLLSTMMNPPQR
tara:strand:+ start:3127 stop:4650 length:1524 start_codon:yes stop_codon:yes gene_type:complete